VASPVVHLPDAQLRPLLAAYDASVRARRWNSMLVVICVVVAVALSSVSAEVDLGKLIANIGNFTSYIYRLFHLESGAWVWTDPVEWYWGLARWLRLLTETLIAGLIATALALLVLSWLGRDIVAGVTPEVDDALRRTIHSHASPRLTPVMIAASHYGGPSWLVPLGLCLALAFLIHGWQRGALLVVVTLGGAGLLNALLKQGFARTRPAPFFDYPLPGSASAVSSSRMDGPPSMGWKRRSTGREGSGRSKSWRSCASSWTKSKSSSPQNV